MKLYIKKITLLVNTGYSDYTQRGGKYFMGLLGVASE